MSKEPPARPYLWMLLGCAAFALMGQCAHALRDRCDWQFVALARSGLALLFAVLLATAGRARFVFFRPRSLWLRSLAGSVSLLCTFFALSRLPTSDVLTLTNMFPIWVAVLSWPLLGETPPGRLWLATLAGLVGVAFIQQPHLAAGNLATFAALAASFGTALAMIGLHRLQGIDTWAIVVHFSAVALVLCVGAVFLFDRSATLRGELFAGPTLLLLLGVGVAATLGQLCLTRAFATGNPSRVSVVGLSQVVFALILDVLLWQEPLTTGKLLGLVLILVPTAWVMRPGPHLDSGSVPDA